jgi:hypothetical protein
MHLNYEGMESTLTLKERIQAPTMVKNLQDRLLVNVRLINTSCLQLRLSRDQCHISRSSSHAWGNKATTTVM